MEHLLALLAIPVCAVLNRLRGDDRWMPAWLRGRPLYYISPVIGLVAWDWRFAVNFLLWGTPAWGFLFGLGRVKPSDRKVSDFEAALLTVCGGNVHLALGLRHTLAVPILWWVVGVYAILFPFAVVGCYEAGWRIWETGWERVKNAPILIGELLTGAVWGCFVALGYFTEWL